MPEISGPTERRKREEDKKRARQYAADGHLAKACIVYEGLLQQVFGRFDRDVRRECGNVYMARQRYEQALAHYRAVGTETSRDLQSRLDLARAYLALKRLPDARAELTKASQTQPDSAEVHALLGDLLAQSDGPQAAGPHYARSTTLEPGRVDTWLAWATLLESSDVGQAVEKLIMALKARPADSRVHGRLSDLLPQLSPRDEARAKIGAIVAAASGADGIEAHLRWGRTLFELGDPPAAFGECMAALRMGAGLGSDRSDVFADLIRALDMNNPQPQLAEVTAALKTASDVPGHLRWADVLSRNALSQPALEQLELAISQEPSNGAVHQAIAAMLRQSDTQERERLAGRIDALLQSVGQAVAHARFASTLLGVGLPERARLALARAGELAQSDADRLAVHEAKAEALTGPGDEDARAAELLEALRLGGPPDALFALLPSRRDWERWVAPVSAIVDSRREPALHAAWAEIPLPRDHSAALDHLQKAAELGLDAGRLADLVQRFDGAEAQDAPPSMRLTRIVAGRADAAVHAAWAGVLNRRRQFDEAAGAYSRATELDPDSMDIWIAVAEFHIQRAQQSPVTDDRRSRWSDVFGACASAVKAEPTNYAAYAAWISGLKAFQEKDGVPARLAELLGGPPSSLTRPVPWEALRDVEELGRRRLGDLRQAIEGNFDHDAGHSYVNLGFRLYDDLGSFPEARRCFERAASYLPSDVEAQNGWALTLQRLGDHGGAVRQFKKAIDLAPEDFQVRYNYALALDASGRHQEACTAFSDAFERGSDPDESTERGRQARRAALADWASALSASGEHESAVAKARLALAAQADDSGMADDAWGEEGARNRAREAFQIRFRLAHALAAAGLRESARQAYEDARPLAPDLPYGDHNIASNYGDEGQYRRARQQWFLVRDRYQEGLARALRRRDGDYCLYYGDLCREVFADYRASETLLLAARALAPEDPLPHLALVRLHLEAKRELERLPVGAASQDNDVANRKIRHTAGVSEAYIAALHLLSRHRPKPDDLADAAPTTLLTLGDAHLLMEESGRSEAAFKEAVARQPTSRRGLLGLGNAQIAVRRYDEAVRTLRAALRHGPEDASVRATLARALLKSGAREEAEREFQTVREQSPFHIDALIGLAELHLDVAAAGDAGERQERHQRAIDLLSDAIRIAESPDRPIGVAGPSSSAYYLRGYARVRLWETRRLGRERRLVQDALRDFRTCRALDSRHLKAAQAIDLIQEERDRARSRSERLVPALIITFSIGLFLLAQAGFLVGLPRWGERMALTGRSFTGLRAAGVDDTALKLLKPIEEVRFVGDEALLARARVLLDKQFDAVKPLVMAHAARGAPELELVRLDATTYGLLTFGALVFLVAGAYLPQLTSIKFPGVQLDKTAIDRVEVSSSVGIRR